MDIRNLAFVGVVLAAGCASSGGSPAPARTQDEEMAAWMKAAGAGPQHQRLASKAGNWDVEGQMWMDPEAPPMGMKGKAKLWNVLDGRFQMQDYEGDFMGAPFHGYGVTGYNNVTGMYEANWFDSMGTMMMRMEGPEDAAGVITLTGTFPDPWGETQHMRHVMRDDGPNHMVLEMYGSCASKHGGAEMKMMELHYRRTK